MRATVHKRLRLQHHRHTGKVLHHRHTSYHGLAIIIGLVSALIIATATMARATADTLLVSARNPAPIPTTPAVITSPVNNTTIYEAELVVSGTCEAADPANIVTILDNGNSAGSAPCTAGGTFSVVISVELGQHTLIARTYTITDDFGPDSDAVTVIRTVRSDSPSSPGQPSSGGPGQPDSGGGGQADTASLAITAERPFITFGPGKDAVWVGNVSGGKPPYKLVIDWGDDNTDEHEAAEAGELRFTHRYRTMKPYIITIGATDAAGQHTVRQYAAVTPYISPITSAAPTQPWNGSLLLGLYGTYLLALVVFGALWALAHRRQYALAPVPIRRANTKYGHRTKRDGRS